MSTSFAPEKRKREGIKVTFATVGPSLTDQTRVDETNINNIIARFHRTGELPQQRTPQYADISSVQQLDPTSAIDLSRSTISTAHNDAQKHFEKQRDEKAQKEREKLKDELRTELQAEVQKQATA